MSEDFEPQHLTLGIEEEFHPVAPRSKELTPLD
jgi:hypothetical protein